MVFQVIDILVLFFFYSLFFGKMLIQKRKGIKTNPMGKDKEGATKVIELTMKFITYILPFIELISIFSNTYVFNDYIRWIGVVIAIIGNVIFGLSIITMKDSWRAGVSKDKTELITNGIYKLSRNPAFLGFDLVYVGILLTFFNTPLLIFSLLAIIIFHIQIVYVEEKALVTMFNNEYLEYKRHVNRYFGRKWDLNH